VLFAGLLNAFGHKGPAEIERKRRFTYELCTVSSYRSRSRKGSSDYRGEGGVTDMASSQVALR
jgi:hypothetical protein